MKLQVAFDVKKYSMLKKIAKKIFPYMDIVEIGTLLIKSEGIDVVRKAKRDFNLPVFADIKCMDAGKAETEIAAENGADYITVLACSYDDNIREVIETCRSYGINSVVDSINSSMERVLHIQDLGIDVIELHTGYMSKVGQRQFDDLKQFYDLAKKPIFISGGISSKNLLELKPYRKKIEVVVVGRAITTSANPKEEAKKIKEILNEL